MLQVLANDIMNIIEILKSKYGIDDELATHLLEMGTVKKLKKGDFLYYQDERANFITIPISGTLSFSPTCEDSGSIQYNLITPGIIVNEVSFLVGGGILTEVKAVIDCCVIQLPYTAAELLMGKSPSFLRMLSISLAKKQRATLALFNLRGEKDAKGKIKKALHVISEATPDGLIPVNIITLASLLCVSRNTVGREIKRFIDNGEIIKIQEGYRFVNSVQKVA